MTIDFPKIPNVFVIISSFILAIRNCNVTNFIFYIKKTYFFITKLICNRFSRNLSKAFLLRSIFAIPS